MPTTHYDLLGVPQTATTGEIKEKYRAAVRICHPDVAVDKVQATRQFVQISRAYRILRDSEMRGRYDQSLQSGGVPPKGAPPGGASARPAEPVDVAHLMQQAERAFFQGQMVEARTFCSTILRQDGRHARALALLGDILVGLNKPEEAAVAYRLSSQIAPSAMLQAKLARLTQSPALSAGGGSAPTSTTDPKPTDPKPAEPRPDSLLKRLFNRP